MLSVTFVIMLSVVMLNVIMLSVITLNVIMLSVVILNVKVLDTFPCKYVSNLPSLFLLILYRANVLRHTLSCNDFYQLQIFATIN